MSEAKDPAIKLFGKTIQLATNDDVSHAVDSEHNSSDHNNNTNNNCNSSSNGSVSPTCFLDKNSACGEGSMDSKLEDGSLSAVLEEQTRYEGKESSSPRASEKEEETETSGSEEKPLKKPDKILPCPRCNSMDTKFCYFNNYNVNQPRHFCKNCQRYWTAGGTMRNVPVGAGRRKNKHSSSNPRFIVIPDAAFQAHPDTPNGMIYPPLRVNAFGSETPLCESMTSTLKIAEKSSSHNVPNGFIGSNPVTQESSTSGFHSFGPRLPCFPAPPWPTQWNPAHWSPSVPHVPFPIPVYATPPYWSCGVPVSSNTTWSSGPNSPLGKHPREGTALKSSNQEQHGEVKKTETKVFVPKTLRIDDPSEAAKSSIWTTLGIKHENNKTLDSGVFFKGLQSKGGHISLAAENSSVLQANPAALSRSLTYHERAE